MNEDSILSQRLQEKRREKGYTQNELARKLNLSRGLYNKYEKAGIRPTHETLVLLANTLGTTVDYLLGNTDDAPKPLTTDDALKIIAEEKGLSYQDIEYLRETIRILELKNKAEKMDNKKAR